MNIFISYTKSALSGVLIFFCLYRVALGDPLAMLNFPVGLLGLTLLVRKGVLGVKSIDPNLRKFLIIAGMVFCYSLLIDLAYFGPGSTIRNLFSVRLLSLLVISAACAYAVEHMVSRGRTDRLNVALIFCISFQMAFFALLFLSPNSKEIVYSIFGMQDSVNLLEFNMFQRGFGVGSELNFTAPITTAIIAILIIRSRLYKAVIIGAQIANTTISVLSLIFYAKHTIRVSLALASLFIIYSQFPDFQLLVEIAFPRFARELATGFTLTLFTLLDEHLLYEGRTVLDLLFGAGVNLLPDTDIILSSDIGWVIMLNYGGIIFIALYLAFIVSLISLTPFDTTRRLMFFACVLILNTKGLMFGPNALFFLFFLTASNSLKRN